MMYANGLVGLIAVCLSLILALRYYRSQHVPFNKTITMLLIWALIIVGLTLIFSAMGSGLPRMVRFAPVMHVR